VLRDLAPLAELAGPFDAVFFTGDFVQTGKTGEYELVDGIIHRIRERLDELGSQPTLFGVPGNHDLVRPAALSGTAQFVDNWPRNLALRTDFWGTPSGEFRTGVMAALANWSTWWESNRSTALADYENGELPGDFRATLDVGDLRIGVVGLNSTFLQLGSGDQEGKLTVDLRQIQKCFPSGIATWGSEHDLTILLTHHPASWLDERGREALLTEVLPPGAFSIHLQGHVHMEQSWLSPLNFAPPRVTILGRSLFGLKMWDDGGVGRERVHGYSAGRVVFSDTARTVRIWPRVATRVREGGWQIGADPHSSLETDQGTRSCDLGTSPRAAGIVRGPDDRSGLFTSGRSRLDGWVRLDPIALARRATALEDFALEAYFDGAAPHWEHAVDRAGIPRRSIVADIVSALEACRTRNTSAVALVVGPGGEGKSTALLQAAADLALVSGWKVMWREDPTASLDARAVSNLVPDGPWLLVSDDAEELVAQIWDGLRASDARRRRDIYFLGAARDTDWIAAGGEHRAWGARLHRFQAQQLTRADAQAFVRAWQRIGDRGLRDLARLSGEDARVDALDAAARRAAAGGEGSLFGAVLSTRFTAADLRAHVQSVIARLEERDPLLRRAFLAIAACEAVGLEGIDRNVLADLLGVPRLRLFTNVVRPLGEEAAAVRAGILIRTRHPEIARVTLGLAEHGGLEEDLADLYALIVRQTLTTERDIPVGVGSWHGGVLHIGPTLLDKLPPQDFDLSRRSAIAIRAAETAYRENLAKPLLQASTLAQTWRLAGQPEEGAAFLGRLAPYARELPDQEALRGLFSEWGVCAGLAKDPFANAVLGAYSLSDHLNPTPISTRDLTKGFGVIGAGLLRSVQSEKTRELAEGLGACAFLMQTSRQLASGEHLAEYLRVAREHGASVPRSVEHAVHDVVEAISSAAAKTDDEYLDKLPGTSRPSFGAMQIALARAPA
jgi:hypothetical protein